MKCPSCGKEISSWKASIGTGVCPECAITQPVDTRYPALITIVSLYYLLALAILCIAIVIVAIATNRSDVLLGAVAIVVGLVGVISCIASAEIIKVFMDTERNTRLSHLALKQIIDSQK